MRKIYSRAILGALIGGGLAVVGAGIANAAETSGTGGLLSGDQAIISVDLPVTIGGNAVSVIGDSHSSDASTSAPASQRAPEATTDGGDSILGGNQGLVSVDVPVTVSGNAVSVIGDSTSTDASTTGPAQVEAPRFYRRDGGVVVSAGDRFELHDVAGTEEHHRFLQVGQGLLRVVDGCGRDPEHLVTTGPAHRVDAAEAAAVTQRQLGRVGARAQVLGYLQLLVLLHHLEHEGQAGHEAHHGDEPRAAAVGCDEGGDIGMTIDARRVLQVGRARVLVAVPKTRLGFIGPGIIVEHRDFDDAGLDATLGGGAGFECLDLFQQLQRMDQVGVEADLERGIGQADIQHARQRQLLDGAGDGHGAEEGLQRHRLRHLGKEVFIAGDAVTDGGVCGS